MKKIILFLSFIFLISLQASNILNVNCNAVEYKNTSLFGYAFYWYNIKAHNVNYSSNCSPRNYWLFFNDSIDFRHPDDNNAKLNFLVANPNSNVIRNDGLELQWGGSNPNFYSFPIMFFSFQSITICGQSLSGGTEVIYASRATNDQAGIWSTNIPPFVSCTTVSPSFNWLGHIRWDRSANVRLHNITFNNNYTLILNFSENSIATYLNLPYFNFTLRDYPAKARSVDYGFGRYRLTYSLYSYRKLAFTSPINDYSYIIHPTDRRFEQNYYRTYLYYGDRAIRPTISFIPQWNIAFIDFKTYYNAYFAPVNVGMYLYDEETNAWYFLPPFAPSNTSLVYSSSVLLYSSGSSGGSSVNILTTPQILPIFSHCSQNTTHLIFSSMFTGTITHFGRSVNCSSSGCTINTINFGNNKQMSGNISIPQGNNSYAEYFVYDGANNQTICRSYSSNTIYIPYQISTDANTTASIKGMLGMVIVGGMVIGTIYPLLLVFPMIINDMFGIISPIHFAPLLILSGTFGIAIRWQGERSLKAVLFLTLFGASIILAYATGMYGVSSIALPSYVQSTLETLQTIASGQVDLYQLALTTVNPIFIINIGLTILTLPYVFVSLIGHLIGIVHPLFSAGWNIIALSVNAGLWFYLILKLYEMFQNRFRGV